MILNAPTGKTSDRTICWAARAADQILWNEYVITIFLEVNAILIATKSL